MKSIFALFTVLFFTTVYFFIKEEGLNHQPPKVNFKAAPVVVVQYCAPWGGVTPYQGLEKLKGCTYIYCNLDQSKYYKTSQRITSVPTIIVYKEGLEVKRWEAGLSMKIDIPLSVIQKEIY